MHYSQTLIERASLQRGFLYYTVGSWLHNGNLLYYHWATITECAIFEASQEKWNTFTYYVCLRGISVYYFKMSQVFCALCK